MDLLQRSALFTRVSVRPYNHHPCTLVRSGNPFLVRLLSRSPCNAGLTRHPPSRDGEAYVTTPALKDTVYRLWIKHASE